MVEYLTEVKQSRVGSSLSPDGKSHNGNKFMSLRFLSTNKRSTECWSEGHDIVEGYEGN